MAYFIHSVNELEKISRVIQSKPPLGKLEKMIVTCILMKSVDKLSILQHTLPRSQGELLGSYQPLPLRMTSLKRIVPEDNEHHGVSRLKHIQKICLFVQSILSETVHELSVQSNCFYLGYILCLENLSIFDDFALKKDCEGLDEKVHLLQKKIADLKKSFKTTQFYLSETMDRCLDQSVVQNYVESEILIRTTEAIQEAKLVQSNFKVKERENALLSTTQECNLEMVEEDRINSEIEIQIYYMTLILQKQLDTMSNQYNREVEALDVAILQLKSKQDEQRERFNNTLELYADRQGIIIELEKEMEVKERELVQKRVQNSAVIKIQHWWRHILFLRFIKNKNVFKKIPKSKNSGKVRKAKKK